VMISIRRPATALGSSSQSSLDTSRSPNQGLSLAHRRAKLKVGSKQRLLFRHCRHCRNISAGRSNRPVSHAG
jgi:hypothetical protein